MRCATSPATPCYRGAVQQAHTGLAWLLLGLMAFGCGRIGFGVGGDGGPDARLPDGATPGSDAATDAPVELCNGLDDDGDTLVDEDFDLTTDPSNCGRCGNACAFPNASARCTAGACALRACLAGWGNCNADDTDGCETGVSSDVANCGRCARACPIGATCGEGICSSDVAQLAAGGDFTCGRIQAGAVYCWGGNSAGQLGDGTNTDSVRPVATLVTSSTVVAAGTAHACAADGSGVLCWGSNSAGQLGDGTTTDSSAPVRALVSGTAGVTAVAAGRAHSCAVLGDGTVSCWGANAAGQLGDGTMNDLLGPVQVVGISGATGVAAGDSHTCAAVGEGAIVCWGSNSDGQLGNGTTTDSPVPVMTGLLFEPNIDVGAFHSCADDEGYCWGRNSEGQLGDGSLTTRTSPVAFLAPGPVGLAVGDAHSCVLTSTQTVFCAGRNADGQLGDGTTTNSPTPVMVPALTQITDVSAGRAHTCAVNRFGVMRCWGANESGQLGDGTRTGRLTAVRVAALP